MSSAIVPLMDIGSDMSNALNIGADDGKKIAHGMVMGMKYEYIEKEFVLYLVQHFGSMLTWSKEDTLAEIEQEVKDTKPIGDVFRVVRCKDCKHFGYNLENDTLCRAVSGLSDPEENDFCSYGERRT